MALGRGQQAGEDELPTIALDDGGDGLGGTPGSTPSKSESHGDKDPSAAGHAHPEPPSLDATATGSSGSGSGSEPKVYRHASSRRGSFRRKPSLETARAFGKRRRPHRIPDASQPSGYRLARVGETEDEATGRPAEEYNVWTTPLKGLDEFGIGISLYFRQLLVLSVLFLVCGLCATPAIYHNTRFNPEGTDLLAKGSATGATRGDFSTWLTMAPDFAVTILLVVFAIVSRQVGATISAKIDEAQQTAQDYSISVLNPDPQLFDADEYKQFFARYGDVVSVAFALNNGALLEAIGDKKELETRLAETVEGERLLEAEAEGWGIDVPTPPLWKRLLFALGLYEEPALLWGRRTVLKQRVAGAVEHQSQYAKVKRVFVTFNTEAAQRRCLQDMYCGILQYLAGHRVLSSTKPQAVFRGRALLLEEPVEPSEVIWQNFRYRAWRRALRFCISVACSGVLLLASYFSLKDMSSKKGSIVSAVLISVINIMLPVVIKFFSTIVELPLTLSEQQSSILFKLALARCANTALLMYAVTGYTELLQDTTMASVMTILITDAVLSPTLQALNLPQRLMQRFLAPRAQTQAAMNSYFQGLPWHLAERYTELSKTLFVSLFWAGILPTGYFVTAAALFFNYLSDKNALFTLWRRPPALNARLVTLSRSVLSFTIFVHVVMSRIFFANWPYADEADRAQCGLFYCADMDQMTRQQKYSVHWYAILGIVVFTVILSGYSWGPAASLVKATRRHFYVSGQGAAIDIPYRRVYGIAAYLPTIDVKDNGNHAEKFLAADLGDNFPRALVPLPRGLDVAQHNLCSPTEVLGLDARDDVPKLFSVVRYYPPDDEAERRAAAAAAAAIAGGAVPVGGPFANASAAAAGGEGRVSVASASSCVAGSVESAAEHFAEMINGAMNTATQPIQSLLLPQDFVASNANDNADGTDTDIEAAAAKEEAKVESTLPDGWEKGVLADGSEGYVSMTSLKEQAERPTRAASWTPWRF